MYCRVYDRIFDSVTYVVCYCYQYSVRANSKSACQQNASSSAAAAATSTSAALTETAQPLENGAAAAAAGGDLLNNPLTLTLVHYLLQYNRFAVLEQFLQDGMCSFSRIVLGVVRKGFFMFLCVLVYVCLCLLMCAFYFGCVLWLCILCAFLHVIIDFHACTCDIFSLLKTVFIHYLPPLQWLIWM